MYNNRENEVVELTSRIMHNFYKKDLDLWFDSLRNDSVWVGSGEPLFYGSESIKNYFKNYYMPEGVRIIHETYTPISLSKSSYIVTGLLNIGREENIISACTLITIGYRYVNDKPTIAYHHMSYDYTNAFSTTKETNSSPQKPMDTAIRLYIRQLSINKDRAIPIPLKIGRNTQYIDPQTIITLNSHGHKTTLQCIDQVIDCSMNIYEFKSLLPDYFFSIRRGCIINPFYMTALRRSEVELVLNTCIQIPAPSFAKVKKELNEIILNRIQSK